MEAKWTHLCQFFGESDDLAKNISRKIFEGDSIFLSLEGKLTFVVLELKLKCFFWGGEVLVTNFVLTLMKAFRHSGLS